MTKLFRSGRFVALLAMLMLTVAASASVVDEDGGVQLLPLRSDRELAEDAAKEAAAAAEAVEAAAAEAEAAAAEEDVQAEAEAEELLEDEEAQSASEPADAAGCEAWDGDPRVRPANVSGMLDAFGQFQLWLFFEMCAALGIEPTPELFSAFTKSSVTHNPTVEIGWEQHAGDDYVLGTTSEAYILDDGTVLIATGLFPTGDYQLVIEVEFGSWEDESGAPPVFGNASFVIDSEAVGVGDDPFVYFGAEPVYDLVAGE